MAGKGAKFNILILLAIIMALVTCVLVFLLLKSSKAEAFKAGKTAGLEEAAGKNVAPGVDPSTLTKIDVLVARQDIAPGTVQITPEMFTVKKMPKDAVPANAFSSMDQIKDRLPAHFIPAGDIIMPSKFRLRNEITRASYLVTPGKRYFSLEINGDRMGPQTVSNMLRVGDNVDILATYNNNGVQISRIILQNLRIMDVVNGDANTKNPNDSEAPRQRLGVGQTITFEGSPQDAEFFKAMQASNIDYAFILRNINDTAIVETDGKRTRDVVSKIIPQEEVVAPTPAAVPVPAGPTRRNY